MSKSKFKTSLNNSYPVFPSFLFITSTFNHSFCSNSNLLFRVVTRTTNYFRQVVHAFSIRRQFKILSSLRLKNIKKVRLPLFSYLFNIISYIICPVLFRTRDFNIVLYPFLGYVHELFTFRVNDPK